MGPLALNTDGIDISGKNFVIERVKITNWDDAVVVKPLNNGDPHPSNCSQDILVQDIDVTYGVGMSIGSLSPEPHRNCIKNVTFRNVHFEQPMKAIYIKTNPGNEGTG